MKIQSRKEELLPLFNEESESEHFLVNEDPFPDFEWEKIGENLRDEGKEVMVCREAKTLESTKTTMSPKAELNDLAEEFFSQNHSQCPSLEEDKEFAEEKPKPTLPKIVPSFSDRVRFSKEHDRGKYLSPYVAFTNRHITLDNHLINLTKETILTVSE